MSERGTAPTAQGRLVWIDAARGACVLAVVVLHACVFLSVLGEDSTALRLWGLACGFGTAVRIPVLMFVSGFLVGRAVDRGWRHRGNWLRVADLAYLYGLWVLVTSLLAPVTTAVHGDAHGAGDVALRLLVPTDHLWYVYALGLWTAVMTLLRALDRRILLVALGSLTVVSAPGLGAQEPSSTAVLVGVLSTGTYFALGVVLRARIRDVTALVTPVRVVAAVGLLCLLQAAARLLPEAPARVAHLGLTVAGIGVGVGVVVLLVRHLPTRVGTGLATVGRHTLPVYLLHMPLLGMVLGLPGVATILTGDAAAVVAPLLLMAAAATTSVLLCAALRRCGAGWLFAMPARVRSLLDEGRGVHVAGRATASRH